ncbi:MAG: phosphate ABC transporter permease subunit PstC [Euryarchaeota archaeon]|nr:phosphate ABC transporter permease subunit PstC [Euryarchaeota archaeon]MDE2046440.1 phosphate ABC transporter permease subunit PstC [Thermoplasmata archaeon]
MIPLVVLGAVIAVLVIASGLKDFGWTFWGFQYRFVPGEPEASSWGIGVFLVGTFLTAGLSLVLATLLSLALAISSVVYLPPLPGRLLSMVTNLLAGIPSVIYGIWGFVVLAPYFGMALEPSLKDVLGWLPGFGGPDSAIGPWGTLLAVFILTIMIIPLTTALMRESLRSVPRELVEAGLALGATRWEVVRRVRMRVARNGLWSAVLLGFGRALGESVAVAMVIGGTSIALPPSLYASSTTVASFIFSQLDSALLYPDLFILLVEFSLVLLGIAVVVNLVAQRFTRVELATATTLGGGG